MTSATEAQVRAATPHASSWVAANAGSGKTRVLTDRVARLLLAGTEPARILCLTYTKAAAAEMQDRLFRTLGAWAMLDDPELRAALAKLGEPADTLPPARLARARTLFASALETPGGLKIQTIHAFCDGLLRRFPLEAGVSPQFTLLEDRQARALRAETLDALARAAPDRVAALARHLSGDDPEPLLKEICASRHAFDAPLDADRLAAALGIRPDITMAEIAGQALTAADLTCLAAFVPILAASGKIDAAAGGKIATALATTDPNRRLAALEGSLLFGKDADVPFGAKIGSFPTKALREAHPHLIAPLDALMRRVEAARPLRLGLLALEKSVALHQFAQAFLAAWYARKAATGLLDFDDLIDRARGLLSEPATAAWVLWRLDGGLDHILVDEAQDTSPAQWRVIEAISAEFFAGLGARNIARTIFVVGDEKQSIYSFQGADPAAFGDMRAQFAGLLDAMGAALEHCALIYSFRSASPILELVDRVFAGSAGAGLGPGITHRAIAPERPGRVELWPFLPKPRTAEDGPWDAPIDAPAPDDPVETLATRIAAEIKGWLDAGTPLPDADGWRPVRARDVLILVQRRAAVFDAVIRALKRTGVPVAGADVLKVGGELAVKDLLAGLRVAATEADDLSLAALLRSPLGGVSEAALFRLAHGRTTTLWQTLGAEPECDHARAMLADLRAQADYLRPFELLERMLLRHDGRRRLVARLGAEAEDGIDALLDQALAYESVEPPSLTGFLAWIDRDEVTVKRRVEDSADQVRVMTVHGAKGLEAPIVILPDTGVRDESKNPPQLLRLDDGAVWKTRADTAPPLFAAAETARRDLVRAENRRLLYVALTRAKSWLIVAGAGTPGAESWHDLVAAGLGELGPGEVHAGPDEIRRRLDWNWSPPEVPDAAPAAPPPAAAPDWTQRPPPQPDEAAAMLAPSALGGAHALPGEGEDTAAAKAHGAALHRLLELLPGRPAADWPRLAALVLPEAADRDALLAEAQAVITAPGLASIFAPGALAEAAFAAPLAELGGRRLAGRVDRLIFAADRVLAVDFKSNRQVPATPEAVPEGILRQMGAYAAALGAIWPERRIETAVVWTQTLRLMYLPAPLTAAALARAAALLDPGGGRP